MFLLVFSFDLIRKTVMAIAPKIIGQMLRYIAEDTNLVISITNKIVKLRISSSPLQGRSGSSH